MAVKCSLQHLFIKAQDLNFLLFCFLAPKDRNRAPNLHMAKNKALWRVLYYHLRLDTISAVAFLIQAPRVEPCTCHLESPARNQQQMSFFTHKLWLILIDVPLNHLETPGLDWDILKHKIFKDVRIPEISRVWLETNGWLLLETRAQI